MQNVKIITDFLAVSGKYSVDGLVLANLKSGLRDLGVLSIDIDSFDYYVFEGIKNIQPQIVVVEFNNFIPAHIDYVDPRGEVFLRCSAKSLERLGREKGYKLVACTVTNAVLLREDCYSAEFHPDMPVEFLFDYSGQKLSNSVAFEVIESQMVTKYSIFSKSPKKSERALFSLRGRIASLLPGRPKYKKPSVAVIKSLREAGLFE